MAVAESKNQAEIKWHASCVISVVMPTGTMSSSLVGIETFAATRDLAHSTVLGYAITRLERLCGHGEERDTAGYAQMNSVERVKFLKGQIERNAAWAATAHITLFGISDDTAVGTELISLW